MHILASCFFYFLFTYLCVSVYGCEWVCVCVYECVWEFLRTYANMWGPEGHPGCQSAQFLGTWIGSSLFLLATDRFQNLPVSSSPTLRSQLYAAAHRLGAWTWVFRLAWEEFYQMSSFAWDHLSLRSKKKLKCLSSIAFCVERAVFKARDKMKAHQYKKPFRGRGREFPIRLWCSGMLHFLVPSTWDTQYHIWGLNTVLNCVLNIQNLKIAVLGKPLKQFSAVHMKFLFFWARWRKVLFQWSRMWAQEDHEMRLVWAVPGEDTSLTEQN